MKSQMYENKKNAFFSRCKKMAMLAFAFAAMQLQTSCSSDAVTNSSTSNPVDVYVAGTKNDMACYWKNSQVEYLNSTGYESTKALKIIISSNDIYVLGIGYNAATNHSTPLFWKNNALTDLGDTFGVPGTTITRINDMIVDGNDVYFLGMANTSSGSVLAYWKNGVMTTLGQDDNTADPNMIVKLNNNIYVLASKTIGGQQYFGYYLNGTFNSLDENVILRGMSRVNNDVYVFGNIESGGNFSGYYKNLTSGIENTVPNTEEVYGVTENDNGNLMWAGNNTAGIATSIFSNSSLTETYENEFIYGLVAWRNNKYMLRHDANPFPQTVYYLDINNVNAMQSVSDEIYYSFDVVQN